MKSWILSLLLSCGLVGVPIAVCGCDRELSHSETTGAEVRWNRQARGDDREGETGRDRR